MPTRPRTALLALTLGFLLTGLSLFGADVAKKVTETKWSNAKEG
jgi:hypothetical protein